MIGVPPTVGFLGKWFILGGAMQSANWIAAGVIILSTLLNAGYYLPVIYRAFFAGQGREARDARISEAPWPMVFALTVTAAATIVLFFLPGIPYSLAILTIGR
jgi:multicomponent Na+:H+ antiporter subunit D